MVRTDGRAATRDHILSKLIKLHMAATRDHILSKLIKLHGRPQEITYLVN